MKPIKTSKMKPFVPTSPAAITRSNIVGPAAARYKAMAVSMAIKMATPKKTELKVLAPQENMPIGA